MTGVGNLGETMLAMQVMLAAVLAWSVLCRATKTNGDTRREVRWSMAFEGLCVGLVGGAPFLPLIYPNSSLFNWPAGTTPPNVWMLFLLSILCVQLATAKYWRDGVPEQLQEAHRFGRHGSANTVMPLVLAMLLVTMMVVPPSLAVAKPSEPQREDVQQVQLIDPGETVTCSYPAGCVGMTTRAFEVLMAAARAGQQAGTCRKPTT